MNKSRPFRINIGPDLVADLQSRLASTRLPDQLESAGSSQGIDPNLLRRAASYWRDSYDWRREEMRLNQLPQFKVEIDGVELHYVHLRADGAARLPILLTHGWPGSFIEFARLGPMLAGLDDAGGPAFDVVVPSLPGYGFSARPSRTGMNLRAIASLWAGLMTSLGYDRFLVQGGDFGAGVSTWLAHDAPQRVVGCHLNFVPGSFAPSYDPAHLSPVEQAFLAAKAAWADEAGAYGHVHGTRPQTLAYALNDSPVGLLAWVLEKFVAWSDGDGEFGGVDLDDVLTDVSIYWFTQTISSSMRLYWETRRSPMSFAFGDTIVVPTAVAHFPREIMMPPPEWVSRVFTDVRRWTTMPRGGHFAALEQPELLAADIRAFALEIA